MEESLLELVKENDINIKLVKNKEGNYGFQIQYDGDTYVPMKTELSAEQCVSELANDLKKLQQSN